MKRLAIFATLALLAGFAFAADTQPASDNIFANDFTQGLGKWVVSKAETTQDATGLKFTKLEKNGGIGIDGGKKEDLSSCKTVDFDMVNGGDKPLKFIFKIKSGKAARTDEKAMALPPGPKTISVTLAGGDIDLTKVDYMKIWSTDTGDVNFTIKKISFSPSAASTTTSAPAPATSTAPAK